MTQSLRRLLLPLAAAAAVAACGSDQTGPGGNDNTLVGTYQAVSVDGSPLPHTVASGVTLKSYTITLRDDRSYDLAFSKEGQTGAVDVSDTGVYTYDSAAGTIEFNGQQIPGTLHATVSGGGGTLTLSSADIGYTVVLQR
jgi:hypothetical protein